MNNSQIERYKDFLKSYKKISNLEDQLKKELEFIQEKILYSEYLNYRPINIADFIQAFIELGQDESIFFDLWKRDDIDLREIDNAEIDNEEMWDRFKIEKIKEKIKEGKPLHHIYIYWENFYGKNTQESHFLHEFFQEVIFTLLNIKERFCKC